MIKLYSAAIMCSCCCVLQVESSQLPVSWYLQNEQRLKSQLLISQRNQTKQRSTIRQLQQKLISTQKNLEKVFNKNQIEALGRRNIRGFKWSDETIKKH